jgi:hypothetical protein
MAGPPEPKGDAHANICLFAFVSRNIDVWVFERFERGQLRRRLEQGGGGLPGDCIEHIDEAAIPELVQQHVASLLSVPSVCFG